MWYNKECDSRLEVIWAKVFVFCHMVGSDWYIYYSYACYNTCIRVIYASFDPPLEIVSVRDIFKKYTPNDPSDENFFSIYIKWLIHP